MLTMDEFRVYLRDPFRPFTVHVADGRRYRVETCADCAVGPDRIHVVAPDVEAFDMVFYRDIVSIEVADEDAA